MLTANGKSYSQNYADRTSIRGGAIAKGGFTPIELPKPGAEMIASGASPP